MKKTYILSSILAAAAMMGAAPETSATNPLEAIGSFVGSLTNTTNFEISSLEGTWDYQSPAVSFKSDQALNKIGGAAASTALEGKLSDYYDKLGLNSMSLTVDAEGAFVMKVKSIQLKGTITKEDDNGYLTFNFSAFGKISLGKLSAYAEKSALGTLTLTFDVSNAIKIVNKVAEVANLSTVKSLTSLLSSYEGIYAGAKLKKTSSSTSTGTTTQSTTTSDSNSSTSTSSGSKLGDALKNLLNSNK